MLAKKCLLIDDDADDHELFKFAIGQLPAPIELSHAYSASEALEKLTGGFFPDYIFLDLNMPRVDGKTFLAKIKSDNKFKVIPVIIYTTSSADKDIEDTKKLGASDFITKPSSIYMLSDRLAKCFSATY